MTKGLDMNKDCYSIETNSMEQTMDFARELAHTQSLADFIFYRGILEPVRLYLQKDSQRDLG